MLSQIAQEHMVILPLFFAPQKLKHARVITAAV
jgi:hypothetical protein